MFHASPPSLLASTYDGIKVAHTQGSCNPLTADLTAGCVSCLGTNRLASWISDHPSPVVLVGAGLYAIGLRSGEVYGFAQREHAREDAGYFCGHRGDLVYLRRRLTQGQQAVVAQVDRLRRRARAPPVLAQTLPQ